MMIWACPIEWFSHSQTCPQYERGTALTPTDYRAALARLILAFEVMSEEQQAQVWPALNP
jgi:hypothetical protein